MRHGDDLVVRGGEDSKTRVPWRYGRIVDPVWRCGRCQDCGRRWWWWCIAVSLLESTDVQEGDGCRTPYQCSKVLAVLESSDAVDGLILEDGDPVERLPVGGALIDDHRAIFTCEDVSCSCTGGVQRYGSNWDLSKFSLERNGSRGLQCDVSTVYMLCGTGGGVSSTVSGIFAIVVTSAYGGMTKFYGCVLRRRQANLEASCM